MAIKKAQGDRYYWANGERVELHPSSDFVAIKTTGEEATLTAAVNASGTSREGSVMLADRNIMLVPAGAAADGMQRSLRAGGASTQSVTVFESLGASGVYLVPNGEIIVKFRAGTGDAVVNKHLAAVNAAIVKSNYPEPAAYLVQVPDSDTITAANALHGDETVEYAEPNFVQITSRPGPNSATVLDHVAELNLPRFDADTERQFQALAGGAAPDPSLGSQWALTKIRAIDAWNI
jgi:thermitase